MISTCPLCNVKTIHPEGSPNLHRCSLNPSQPTIPPNMIRSIPGTELASYIPNFFKKDGCGCDEYIEKMNNWGVYGCLRRRDKIVNHLISQARARNFPEFLSRPTAEYWVDKALNHARKVYPSRTPIQGKNTTGGTSTEGRCKHYVAITAAPRSPETLTRCVNSLRMAGWEPVVFAEPGTPEADVEMVYNSTRRGCWHNWLHSARYAVEHSDAPYIMTVQDDVAFHPDSKTLLESYLWPSPDTGFISLYTPKHYGRHGHNQRPRKPGIHRISTISLWGACALVFPREVLEVAVNHPRALNWFGAKPRSGNPGVYENRKNNPHLIANSDTAIGRIIVNMHKTMWFLCPSPATHFATTSSIGHGGNGGRRNCNPCADHKQPLTEQIPLPRKVFQVGTTEVN